MKFGLYTLVLENHLLLPNFLFEFGWGMGYVLLPTNHPLYGIHYDDLTVTAHGGITLSEYFDSKQFLRWTSGRKILGDVTLENYQRFDNYWMIGFDTNHSGDDLINCSEVYVLSETQNLLEQCLSMNIEGMKKYLTVYLRKDKLSKIKNI